MRVPDGAPVGRWQPVAADGSFEASGLTPGQLEIRIAVDGVEQRSISVPAVAVRPGEVLAPREWNPIEVKERIRRYKVRVVDSAGVPVVGALVRCSPRDEGARDHWTDEHGSTTVRAVESRPLIGAFKAEKDGIRGSRPTLVTAADEHVEIVLEDRIAVRIAVIGDFRIPSPKQRLHARISPWPHLTTPDDSTAESRPARHPDLNWTMFLNNGGWVDDVTREATIELPWAGHYVVWVSVAETEQVDLRAMAHSKVIPILVKDEPGQVFRVEVTQVGVDAALQLVAEYVREWNRVGQASRK